MLEKLATARLMGVRAYRAGKGFDDNPFIEPQLHRAWHIAWMAENYKDIERLHRRECKQGNNE